MQHHCDSCVIVGKCNLLQFGNDSCAIIDCKNACGARFHACKEDEHELLCSHVKVPCLNKLYGCPAVIYRRHITKHLKDCPASIVYCGLGWNRWALYRNSKYEFEPQVHKNALAAGYLQCKPDVGLARRDKFNFEKWRMHFITSAPEPLFSDVYCSVNFIANGEVSDVFTGDFTLHTIYTEFCDKVTSFQKYRSGKVMFGVQTKVIYHFTCREVFRRKDYEWHVRNVHNDIHGGVNAWIQHRCPLSYRGCKFSLRKLYPNNKESCIVQNTSGSFGLNPGFCHDPVIVDNMTTTNSMDFETEEACSFEKEIARNTDLLICTTELMDLPCELLTIIASYLDSFSLHHLATTCKKMDTVCKSVVQKKGMVIIDWKKSYTENSDVHWEMKPPRWVFSSSFSPIYRWGLEETNGAMANHMQECPYYVRNTRSEEPVKVFMAC